MASVLTLFSGTVLATEALSNVQIVSCPPVQSIIAACPTLYIDPSYWVSGVLLILAGVVCVVAALPFVWREAKPTSSEAAASS